VATALSSILSRSLRARSPDAVADEPARYIEGKITTPKGPLTVGGIYLPNGNPIGTEKVRLQDRLDGSAEPACEGPALPRGDVRAGRRLTMSARPRSTCSIPRPLPTTRSASRSRALHLRTLLNLGSDRRGARLPSRYTVLHLLDYQAGAWAKATASGSTTCCSRRRPPTGLTAVGIDKTERAPARAVRPRSRVVRARSWRPSLSCSFGPRASRPLMIMSGRDARGPEET